MNLKPYIALIKSGEVVAFPTETVYGLGADAWNPSAIQKVFTIKGRPSDNPLIVHVSSIDQVKDFAEDLPNHAHRLIDAFWPGPLSLVLKKKPEVLDAVTAGLNTVAIRMPAHPLAQKFIQQTGPLVAPSANLSGKPSPTKAEHVRADFGSDFPVIDGQATEVGLESTVLDISETIPTLLRPGSISRKEIEAVLGIPVDEAVFHPEKAPRSPGQKYSHYKPKAAVRWMKESEIPSENNCLYLLAGNGENSANRVCYHSDLGMMAKELYDRFRQADLQNFGEIAIQLPTSTSQQSVYAALVNRISKAIGN